VVMQEFIKAASAYQKTCLKLSEDGKKLAEIMSKIALTQQNDVGEGIQRLADTIRNLETKRENLGRSYQDDLINALQKSIKPEETELTQFEGEYKKARDNSRQQVSKLEMNSKKAAKRGPEALKQAIAVLNDKIKEADQIKADKLRAVLLLERKKYCNFLSQWGPVITAEIDLCLDESKFKENESYWKNIAGSSAQLPAAEEDLIKAQQERTFISLQPDNSGHGSYQQAWDDDYTSSPNQFGNSQAPPYPGGPTSGGSIGRSASYVNNSNLGTATALYDFAGEQDGDLPFYAGEVIFVTKDDDGSGWLTGELNGRSGIFPTSYVQR